MRTTAQPRPIDLSHQPFLAPLSRPLAMLRRWRQTARERRQLEEMDDRMLRDIGLAREDARREAARPFWDARQL